MIKEKRIPCFVSVCEKCGEVMILPKQDNIPNVPRFCHMCGIETQYKAGYITENKMKNTEEVFKTVCGEINDNSNNFIIKRAIKLMLELEEKKMTHTNEYIECLKLIRQCTEF